MGMRSRAAAHPRPMSRLIPWGRGPRPRVAHRSLCKAYHRRYLLSSEIIKPEVPAIPFRGCEFKNALIRTPGVVGGNTIAHRVQSGGGSALPGLLFSPRSGFMEQGRCPSEKHRTAWDRGMGMPFWTACGSALRVSSHREWLGSLQGSEKSSSLYTAIKSSSRRVWGGSPRGCDFRLGESA